MDRGKYYQDKIMSYLSDDDDILDIQINNFGKTLSVYLIYYEGFNREDCKGYYYKVTYKDIVSVQFKTDFNGLWGLDDNMQAYNRPHYQRDEKPRFGFLAYITVTELQNGLLEVLDDTWFIYRVVCKDINVELKPLKQDGTFFWENNPYMQSDFEY